MSYNRQCCQEFLFFLCSTYSRQCWVSMLVIWSPIILLVHTHAHTDRLKSHQLDLKVCLQRWASEKDKPCGNARVTIQTSLLTLSHVQTDRVASQSVTEVPPDCSWVVCPCKPHHLKSTAKMCFFLLAYRIFCTLIFWCGKSQGREAMQPLEGLGCRLLLLFPAVYSCRS